VSLRPILEAPATATVKPYALSTFPRCAHEGMPVYGARGTPGGADNSCLEVSQNLMAMGDRVIPMPPTCSIFQ
jgi:hypothetical protein